MLPMRTPPNMLQPPNRVLIKGALAGLQKLTLTAMAEKIAEMPDEAKAIALLHEIDHLLWLKTTAYKGCELYASQLEKEVAPGRWEPDDPAALKWVLLDRYRDVHLDDEVRDWLEHGDDPQA